MTSSKTGNYDVLLLNSFPIITSFIDENKFENPQENSSRRIEI